MIEQFKQAGRSALNPKELESLSLTVQLWGSLLELKELHPDDIHEHRRDIHNIQNRIMARKHRKQLTNETK